MAGKNCVKGESCYLFSIPAYASHIYHSKNGKGLAGEITVPPTSLEFWNYTGHSKIVKEKNVIELADNNSYRFDKKNLLDYLKIVKQEYISSTLYEYVKFGKKGEEWKNINEFGWQYRYNHIMDEAFDTEFDAYMKITKDSDEKKGPRYYLSSKSDQYDFVIGYCLIPGFTNIRIDCEQKEDGTNVYTFFLEAIGFDNIEKIVKEKFEKKESKCSKEKEDKLFKKAKEKSEREKQEGKVTTTVVYDRNPEVSAYVKKRAKGKCDLCGKKAPFKDRKGLPYLEEHHVIRLADGGNDSIDNAVALCPNCHRKVHVIKSNDVNNSLLLRLMTYAEKEKKYRM